MKYLVIVLVGFSSCTLLSPSTSSTSYYEDVSVHRPTVASEEDNKEIPTEQESAINVVPVNHQTEEIDEKLNGIVSNNKTSNTAPGYTIQVYSGTSREQASEAKSQVYKILPESRPVTRYEQPIYRVRVGEFVDRLEAQYTYAELLKEFPQAIVIPSRIRLN